MRSKKPYDEDPEEYLKKISSIRKRDRMNFKTKQRRAIEAAPNRVANVLTRFFSNDNHTRYKIEETRALMAWEKYVGLPAARVSRALRIQNNTLTVQVRDPIWMQQLALLKSELVRRYRADFPLLGVKNIFFARA